MYLRILKKDLKRKKTMNVILLLFIILATMFVSSSVNNIMSVTTALEDYFEMANIPDYIALTVNKSGSADIDGVLSKAPSVESYGKEELIYIASTEVSFEDEEMKVSSGSNFVQSDKDLAMNYFLDDESILTDVEPGELYMTARTAEELGLEIGDKLSIEIEDVCREYTFAGGIRDAAFGANQVNVTRYIISGEDFEAYTSVDRISQFYGGSMIYIHTPDVDAMRSEISEISDSIAQTMDRAFLKFAYIFDMIVTGILLVVSLILIAVAFVVLRFTITFTLSEEFREIGVMKAIGIRNLKIRGLYLTKYAALSVIGATIGLVLSFPFGKMMMSISSPSVIMGNQNPIFMNVISAVFVIAVILLFCYGCTGKVKKMSPIDAIRNGQTGERFRKKSVMSLGKSKLGTSAFLATNDIVSSPKRYGIITLTFFLCLSLLLILSASVTTLKSDSLIPAFGMAEFDVILPIGEELMEFQVEGGRDKLKAHLEEIEATLAENGMPADCAQEILFSLPVVYGESEMTSFLYQGTGTTMDMYEYTAGSAPQNCGEIAITRITAEALNVDIGDTVTIQMMEGDKEFIITAFFQSMSSNGDGIRLYEGEEINYLSANGAVGGVQIRFSDNPDGEEIARRIERIRELYPEYEEIQTAAEFVTDCVGVAETMVAIKWMVVCFTIVLSALITVLMERSFIAKEQGEIALMKAVGMRNGRIYAYHTVRFAIVGVVAVVIAELLAIPLTHLCIDPIFKMMGMELAVDYVINPVEMYLLLPLVVLVTTVLSAYLTVLYTRNIKASDTANIE